MCPKSLLTWQVMLILWLWKEWWVLAALTKHRWFFLPIIYIACQVVIFAISNVCVVVLVDYNLISNAGRVVELRQICMLNLNVIPWRLEWLAVYSCELLFYIHSLLLSLTAILWMQLGQASRSCPVSWWEALWLCIQVQWSFKWLKQLLNSYWQMAGWIDVFFVILFNMDTL